MGTWGAGLYSNDIAKDLKSTISAVVRVPFETDQLVDIIAKSFPEAANDEGDEDHTTFWLVLADQMHRKGIVCQDAFDRAIDIVDTGRDLNSPSIREMSSANQRKRQLSLEALRKMISSPAPKKTRKIMKKPQPLVMDAGDILTFPIVDTGGCINPYSARSTPDCADWGAAVIVTCGHAFGFLAHYTPIVINQRLHTKSIPTTDTFVDKVGWRLARPGTCSKTHYARMQIEKIGHVSIDGDQLNNLFPTMRDGTYAAINDVSISNSLYVFPQPREQDVQIDSLNSILRR